MIDGSGIFFIFICGPCRAVEACQTKKKKLTIMMELRFDCLCLGLFFSTGLKMDGTVKKKLEILSKLYSLNNSFITL